MDRISNDNRVDALEERYKLNRKIVIRFLKDIGLYNAWIDYLKYRKGITGCRHICDVYREMNIDDVFNCRPFTLFLEKKYNLSFTSTMTHIFRYYLLSKNICNRNELSSDIIANAMGDASFNKHTGEFILKERVWKNMTGRNMER